MNKTLLGIVVVVIIAAVGYVIFQSGSSNKDENVTASPTATVSATPSGSASTAEAAVGITNFAFSPDSVKVKVGATVTWTNQDSVNHTVTSDSGPATFDSGTMANAKTFSFTFTQAGTYTYHCAFHPFMTGTVVVE